MSLPIVIQSVSHLREFRKSVNGIVGVVPTMGALHEGHATLLRRLRPVCDISVLTVFVNPTQFGPNEDLSRYPRPFEKDLAVAAAEGVDVVFAPAPEEIYPEGFSTYVEETSLSQPFCGVFRPGHFKGVTTVVLKLFNLIQPHIALFGLKDAQQFFVISKMVQDLSLDVSVVGAPTVREKDGLAMSSRNIYLTPSEREKAPLLYRSLQKISHDVVQNPQLDICLRLREEKETLNRLGFQVQYLDCVELPSFRASITGRVAEKSYLIAIAAHLGKTRLIDNILLGHEQLRGYSFLSELHRA